MITKETKLKILENILSTKIFKSSRTYNKLLTYLVDASLKEVKLKEFTIAVDVFEKDSKFNPSEDASIRVYISNLRKKLDHYYSHEGEDDKYRVSIPKGGYDLEFTSYISTKKNRNNKIIKSVLYTSAFLLLAFVANQIFNYVSQQTNLFGDRKSIIHTPTWENLANSKNRKLVVLGNDLFFLEGIDSEEKIVRKHNVNTLAEFENYKRENKDRDILGITPYPFYPKMDYSLFSKLVRQILPENNLEFSNSFDLTPNDLLENDIIFFGAFRNLHFLNYMMKDSLFQFQVERDNNFISIQNQDSVEILHLSGEPGKDFVDYCLFRKIPGPNKNTIYMFISFFETGKDAAIKEMLSESYSEKLNQLFRTKYDEMPEYFDILFRVSAYSRTAFTTDIKFIHKTNSFNIGLW